MKFVDDLKNYKVSREQAIQDKKDKLNKLKSDYKAKLDQVSAAEETYKSNFDDAVFEQLAGYKTEADKLKGDIDKANLQVSLMDVGYLILNDDDITSQIKEYVDGFNLDKLKEDILQAKQNYLDSIQRFVDATGTLEATRNEINSLSNVINEHNKGVITRALYNSELYYMSDPKYYATDYSDLQGKIRTQAYNIGDQFKREV